MAFDMVGRKVKSVWGDKGVVVDWQPLMSGMCDATVKHEDGCIVCHASHTLRPTDGMGELPSRQEFREAADRRALASLRAIRADHVRDFHEPWPGAEHGKAIIGKAIDGAIQRLTK